MRKIGKPSQQLFAPCARWVFLQRESSTSTFLKRVVQYLSEFLESGFIPEIERRSLATSRAALKEKFDQSGKEMKKDGGVEILSGEDRAAANSLFDSLSTYGLFVVRRGQLESWLPMLYVRGHGPDWLISMFEKMGEDPDSNSYLKPSENDVWQFIANIKRWLANPDRKGIR